MKFGLNVINSWPAKFILRMAVAADEAGWEGFFLWDHITFPWVVPIQDPWIVLGAIAARTKKLRLGPLVTPLARRRPQIVSRQAVTLDHLSNGLAVLGVGLGYDKDFTAFGEEFDTKVLAEKLDEAIDVITELWSGEVVEHGGKHYAIDGVTFLPKPVQEPRIPIWVGGASRGALRRAGKYEGWVAVGPAPSAKEEGLSLEQVSRDVERIRQYRHNNDPFDVVYITDFPEDKRPLRETVQKADSAGVTWLLEHIYGLRYSAEQALERVKKGPPTI